MHPDGQHHNDKPTHSNHTPFSHINGEDSSIPDVESERFDLAYMANHCNQSYTHSHDDWLTEQDKALLFDLPDNGENPSVLLEVPNRGTGWKLELKWIHTEKFKQDKATY